MKRSLFILLAVVLGWFTPAHAFAHTRAVVYDVGSSLEKVVLVAGITMDTSEGDQEDPLSLHKYLYCEANAINETDPNGLSGETLETRRGKSVEKVIKAKFKASGPLRFAGPATLTILRKIDTIGFARPIGKYLFPDLTDAKNHEVYEIKPDNVRQIAEGAVQLAVYLAEFKALDPNNKWIPGTEGNFNSTAFFPIYDPPDEIVVFPPLLGIITYSSLDNFVAKRVKNLAESETADVVGSVLDGALDTMLGAP